MDKHQGNASVGCSAENPNITIWLTNEQNRSMSWLHCKRLYIFFRHLTFRVLSLNKWHPVVKSNRYVKTTSKCLVGVTIKCVCYATENTEIMKRDTFKIRQWSKSNTQSVMHGGVDKDLKCDCLSHGNKIYCLHLAKFTFRNLVI